MTQGSDKKGKCQQVFLPLVIFHPFLYLRILINRWKLKNIAGVQD